LNSWEHRIPTKKTGNKWLWSENMPGVAHNKGKARFNSVG
jgi:hypothetical protein